jgi:acetoin utilization protein AcuC
MGELSAEALPADTVRAMACETTVVWDEGYLAYDFGKHPMNPLRLELTIRLARELGVLDQLEVRPPIIADESLLLTAHRADYLAAVRRASVDPGFNGYGLGTDDDPVFPGMYEASALIAGGSALAARAVWSGQVEHAVNIAGGLHHGQRGTSAGDGRRRLAARVPCGRPGRGAGVRRGRARHAVRLRHAP